MKIKCDDREAGNVLEMMHQTGLNVKVKRLVCCDYVCDELGIGIERKTIDDFCGSIVSGRLKKQAKRMLAQYETCFVIVSGRIADRKSPINEHCILGMIVSLTVSGINVICVDTDLQLVYVMKRIFERYILLNKLKKKVMADV